jgi:hypothetical protein
MEIAGKDFITGTTLEKRRITVVKQYEVLYRCCIGITLIGSRSDR